MDDLIPIGTYRGFEIKVDDRGWFRVATGEPNDIYGQGGRAITAETMESIHHSIDRLIAQRTKSRKVSLDVVTDAGRRLTVKGVSRTTGDVVVDEPDGLGRGDGLYMPVDWVIQSLAEIVSLQARISKLHKKLDPFKLVSSRTDYRTREAKLAPENYPVLLDELEAEYKAKLQAAVLDGGEE